VKKPRPSKAKNKARGTAKQPRLNASHPAQVDTARAALPTADKPKQSPQQAKPHPDQAAWRWHQTARGPAGQNSGSKQRRAKGPPPPKPIKVPAAAALVQRRTKSKLAPHLEARLAAPLPAPSPAIPVWLLARRRAAHNWRTDRLAAVILLLPTLVTAAFLAALPLAKAPLETTTLVASLKTPRQPTSPPAAVDTATAIPPPATTPQQDHPPFTRPPEGATPANTWAAHDLNTIIPQLTQDIAALAPPYQRPHYQRLPERLAPSTPMAAHDLTLAAAALSRDAAEAHAIALPAFTRPPEALAVVVAEAPATSSVVAMLPLETRVPATTPSVIIEPSAELATATTCRAPAGLLEARSSKRSTPATAALSPLPPLHPDLRLAEDPLRFGRALAAAAIEQKNDLVVYNARYMQISFPRGDVPALFGVCTDVVIRAYRALDIDLQELVYQSRTGTTDTNIDHRRTELLRKFFATHGEQLSLSPHSEDYLPGDIVTYYRPQNKSSTAHIAIVTDLIAPSGRPMIAHNRGWGVQLEDALFVDQLTGHYRFRGLAETAVAALPRNVAVAAAKRPAVRTANAARSPSITPPAAASTDANIQSLLSQPAGLPPAMGLGGPNETAAPRTAQARCTPASKSALASVCRVPGAAFPHQP
jgi:uncharacterized protein YijF (DUF1287 family)